MLPKKNRLPKTDFKNIFQKGKRIHSDYFVLVSLSNTEVRAPQIAVVTSIKVGKAVKRNLVKRRVQEIFKGIFPNIPPNSQIIVICKPTITSLRYQQLQKQLLAALKKGNLYSNNV